LTTFKINDKVLVKNKFTEAQINKYENHEIGWIDDMQNIVGKIGTVIEIIGDHVLVRFEGFYEGSEIVQWYILHEDLELVEETATVDTQVVEEVAHIKEEVVKMRKVDFDFMMEKLCYEDEQLFKHFVNTFKG
jgi:hypothetical protein